VIVVRRLVGVVLRGPLFGLCHVRTPVATGGRRMRRHGTQPPRKHGGRYWDRTSDLFRVKEARGSSFSWRVLTLFATPVGA
jgi:hypothetical protein